MNVTTPRTFGQSAESFVDLLSRVRPEQWDAPGLGRWTVRDLAGHTSRAVLTVSTYLGLDEPSDVTIPSAEAWYSAYASQFTDADGVHARGVEAGRWLGDDPAGRVAEALAESRAALDRAPSNRIVSLGGMGIPLGEYLRTRVFELVVHTIDLSRATGLAHTLPTAAVADTAALAARTATMQGHGEEVLLALTGRGRLGDGFSVV